MKGNSSKGNPLIAAISKRLRRIRGDRLAAIQGRINSRKTLEKVEKHLARWVRDGKHHECYDSMEEILDELDLTNQELSFYCSRILNKKFLTWRKEIRIETRKSSFWSILRLLYVTLAMSWVSATNPTSDGSSGK